MTDRKHSPAWVADLRRQAEERAAAVAAAAPPAASGSAVDAARLLHELQVHQIEVELQNVELRAAQVGLDAARSRYFDLYDLAPVGYVTINAAELILEANLTAATLLGVTRGALVGRPLSRFILSEDQGIHYRHRDQLFGARSAADPGSGQTGPWRAGTAQAYELRLVRPDGTAFWAHLVASVAPAAATAALGPRESAPASPAPPAEGASVCRVVMSDITERKRAEEELLEAKALMDAVVENVPFMIFLKEAMDLRFVVLNRAGEELLGYDRRTLLGRNNLDLFPPAQAAHFMAQDREVLDGEAGVLDIPEEPILTARKGQRLLHTRKVCIRGRDGTTRFLLGISEDITERRQAEEDLRKSEERYRGIFDESVAAVFIFDVQKRFSDANQAGVDLLGYPKEELLQMCIADVDCDPVVVLPAHAELLSGGRLLNYEHRLRRKDGTIVTVLNNSKPLTDGAGNVVGMLSTLIDISARKQTEELVAQQLDELRRWQAVTLGREGRIAELKGEVNALAARLAQPPPYATPEDSPAYHT